MATFLDLLADGAPRAEFDRLLAGSDGDQAELRREYDLALRLQERMRRQDQRERETAALYETASDLTAIRDVDAILTAIVRRARQLLRADMTYLSLNDEQDGASYMKVTDGALTPEFARLRLPLGTGLLGLVAQRGAPYFTEDYQADARFVHRTYIDDAVAGERIRAILGVPLLVEGEVIGTLLAVHRSVRPFPPEEVSLLTSFAAHAAVALENARLFAELDRAHRTMTEHTAAVERAAAAHDRLTDLLLHGGGVDEVAEALAGLLDAGLAVYGPDGALLAGPPVPAGPAWDAAVAESVASGRSVSADGLLVAAAMAGSEHLATLVLHPRQPEPDEAERRTLERGALVTALVLLFARAAAEAEERLGSELLTDLLERRMGAPVRVRERLRRRGASLAPPLVGLAAAVEGMERYAATRIVARLAAGRHGLAGEHHGAVVLVVPGEDPLGLGEELHTALAGAGGEATIGCALSTEPEVAGVRAAYDDARRCLDALLSLGRRGEVADARALGLARLLLGDNGPEAVAEFLTDALGPVLEWDAARGTSLVDTLDAWYAAGGRHKDAAVALHVHPNTVVQRLDRVTELLGRGWRDPDRALDLQLALRLRRLHGG